MENLTLSQIIEQLEDWKDNTICDINSDWIDDEQKRKMQTQLLLLNSSIGNLITIEEIGENNNISIN